jgi:predicted component of type VI protein secretion system
MALPSAEIVEIDLRGDPLVNPNKWLSSKPGKIPLFLMYCGGKFYETT